MFYEIYRHERTAKCAIVCIYVYYGCAILWGNFDVRLHVLLFVYMYIMGVQFCGVILMFDYMFN